MPMKNCVMIILVLLLVPLHLISSYISYNTNKEERNYYEKTLVEYSVKGILNQMKVSKKGYNFIAAQYTARMSKELKRFNEIYEAHNGNPAKIDLLQVKAGGPSYLDYYIINKKNVIINSTFLPVLGLDFTSDKPFSVALEKVREAKKIVVSKVTTERETGKLRKWAYLPTKDEEYILEVGLTNEELQKNIKLLDFKDLEKIIINSSPMITSATIYDAHHRNSTKIMLETNPQVLKQLDEVFKTRKTQDIYDEDGILDKKIMYFNESDNPIDGSGHAVEIKYNNASIRKSLLELRNDSIISFLIFMGVLLVVMNYFFNKFVIKPITELKDGVNKLAEGKLSEHKNIAVLKGKYGNNEVGVLARAFYDMAHNLEKTLVSRNYLGNIIDSVGDIIIITDKKLKITDINTYGVEIIGKEKNEILEFNFEDYFLEKKKIKENIFKLLNKKNVNETFQLELTMLIGAKKLPVIANVRCHFDDDKKVAGFVFSIRDIVKLRDMLEKMQDNAKILIQEAQQDPLTGCLNRRGIEEVFEKVFYVDEEHKKPFSILMFDVDDFKGINDNCGHIIGDEFLVEFSAILKDHLRKTDYVVRYGGEEFLLVLDGNSLEIAKAIAERVRLNVEKRVFTSAKIRRTISGGIALSNVEDKSIEAVIDRADKYLYKSKNSGKNQVNFE